MGVRRPRPRCEQPAVLRRAADERRLAPLQRLMQHHHLARANFDRRLVGWIALGDFLAEFADGARG